MMPAIDDMDRARYALHGCIPGDVEAFDGGETWNGWACPLFSLSQGLKLAEAWNPDTPSTLYYEAQGDRFVWDGADGNGEQQREVFERDPETGLYPIGTRAWTWEHSDEAESD